MFARLLSLVDQRVFTRYYMVLYSVRLFADVMSILCSVINARPTIRCLCLAFTVFFGGLEREIFVEKPKIAWLREHVHVEELSICRRCDAVRDYVDGFLWEHDCEIED